MTSQERARRNEALSLLTSAEGEFNEVDDEDDSKADAAAAATARKKEDDEKPARLGQVTPASKAAAEAIKDGTAGSDPFTNQTLMRLLMEGITMPRNGKWKEANVKSLLVHHPAAVGGTSGANKAGSRANKGPGDASFSSQLCSSRHTKEMHRDVDDRANRTKTRNGMRS